MQEEKQALRDEEIGECIVYKVYVVIFFYHTIICQYMHHSTKFASESITRGMGEKRTIGEAAAGAAGIAGDGKNEEIGV